MSLEWQALRLWKHRGRFTWKIRPYLKLPLVIVLLLPLLLKSFPSASAGKHWMQHEQKEVLREWWQQKSIKLRLLMLVEINAEGVAPCLHASCCYLKRSQPSHSEICQGMTVAARRAHCRERQRSTLPLQIPFIKGKAEKHCCARWPSLHAFFKALYSNAERLLRYLTKTFFMLLLY